MRRKLRIGGGLALLGAVLVGAAALYGGYRLLEQPHGEQIVQVVEIPRGAGQARIGSLLSEVGLLRSPLLFRAALRARPSSRAVQAGRYQISQPISPFDLLDLLREGRTQQLRVTLREGLDWWETVSILVANRLGSRVRFGQLVASPELIRDLDSEARDLEGYLFPETYLFPVPAGEEEIIRSLLSQARRPWTRERRDRAGQLGLSLRQVVTLASLIEKETGRPEERILVSSVFHNRLRRNIKLACDPTVIYAVKRIKEYDGIIHRSDLELDSPYNTYLYPGLPPGPIANPGLASIDAALNPAPTDYLYFVSRNDGTHVFSRTYEEHERAVRKYQR